MRELLNNCKITKSAYVFWNAKKHTIIISILCVLVWSLAANLFAYVNLIPQHDALMHVGGFASDWEISLGRFLLPCYGWIKGEIAVPWMTGLLSIAFISIMCFMICDLMNMTSRESIIMISGILSSNLCITELNSTFQYVLDAYMFSAMLSVAGVYAIIELKSRKSLIAASILFFISIGLYQSEIIIAVMILVVYVVCELIGNRGSKNYLDIIKRFICSIIVATLSYCVVYKVILVISNLKAAKSYNGIASISNLTVRDMVCDLKSNLLFLFSFFFIDSGNISIGMRLCNIVLFVLLICLLLLFIYKNRDFKLYISMIVVGLMSLPCLSIITAVLMHQGMPRFYVCYSIFFLYISAICIVMSFVDKCRVRSGNLINVILLGCIIIMSFSNIRYSNEIYTHQKVMYDRTLSVVNQVLYEINHIDGYIPGETEVIVVTDDLVSNDYLTLIDLPNVGYRPGNQKLVITYSGTFESFAYLMGQDVNLVGGNVLDENDKAYIMNMPVYPLNGYIQAVNGHIVVKLSETEFF